jgi:hypothetical protein
MTGGKDNDNGEERTMARTKTTTVGRVDNNGGKGMAMARKNDDSERLTMWVEGMITARKER